MKGNPDYEIEQTSLVSFGIKMVGYRKETEELEKDTRNTERALRLRSPERAGRKTEAKGPTEIALTQLEEAEKRIDTMQASMDKKRRK